MNLKIFFSRTTGSNLTNLSTKHPLVMGIQVCSNEGPRSFPRGDNYELNLLLQNHRADFNKTWHKPSLGDGDSILFKFKGRWLQNKENTLMNLKIFFSRTTGPILTHLSTKHPCIMGIQICSNWGNLKIFFSRNTGPISSKLGTKHPWVMGIQVCSNEGPQPFPRGDNYEITKYIYEI